jgi:hypothetical protein
MRHPQSQHAPMSDKLQLVVSWQLDTLGLTYATSLLILGVSLCETRQAEAYRTLARAISEAAPRAHNSKAALTNI